ncbi:MAG: hypothetical protein PHF00_04835 [Elusimicrobia bacterium]|nr:hypothetical protein [Elusimicrobiota bacterium]
MNRLMTCVLLLLASAGAAVPAAADVYGGFEQFADGPSLKPFARDLGGVLGSAAFHSGRPLGFSGFDAGVRMGMQFRPEGGDGILRRKGVKEFGVPWVQAEIGLPYRFDGFIRGVSYEGLTIAGGGLRYGVFKAPDKPWTPQLLISGAAHSVVHQYFSASHVGGSLVCSLGNNVITPYIGGGVDRTRLVVRASKLEPALDGSTVSVLETRYTAGVTLRPWNYGAGTAESGRARPWSFVYLNAAYILVHGQSGAEAGLGVRF